MDIITILLGVSSATSVVLGVLAQMQKNKTEAANQLIDNLQEQAKDCIAEERALRREVRELETENRNLRRKNWEDNTGAIGGGRGPYPE